MTQVLCGTAVALLASVASAPACIVEFTGSSASSSFGHTSAGQTLTACANGYVTEIAIVFDGTPVSARTLSLFVGGSPLVAPAYTQAGVSLTGPGLVPISLATPFPVLSGSVYTFEIDHGNGFRFDFDGVSPEAAWFSGTFFGGVSIEHRVTIAESVCGDAVEDPGEQCDDGNLDDGDCCSSTCQYESAGSACADADLCNGNETCDGAGTCQGDAPLDCDDSNACTQDACLPATGCENLAEPASGCLDTWAKGSLLVKESVPGKEKLLAKLLEGPTLLQGDLGDPLSPGGTAYTVCIYDDADQLAGKLDVDRAGDQCAGKDCWRGVGPLGYLYKDKDVSSDGVKSLKLLGGTAGKSKILLKAANNSSKGQVSLPTGIAAALSGSTSATVQIHGSNAPACFSTTLSTVVKDTGSFFQAR